jgi:hypothetical protein
MKHLVLPSVSSTTALVNLCNWSLDFVEYTKNLEVKSEGEGVFACYIPHEADLVGSLTIHVPPENIEWIKICDRPKTHNPSTNTIWFQEKLPQSTYPFLCDGTEPRPWSMRAFNPYLQTVEERQSSGFVRFKFTGGYYGSESAASDYLAVSVRLRMLSQDLRNPLKADPASYGIEGF